MPIKVPPEKSNFDPFPDGFSEADFSKNLKENDEESILVSNPEVTVNQENLDVKESSVPRKKEYTCCGRTIYGSGAYRVHCLNWHRNSIKIGDQQFYRDENDEFICPGCQKHARIHQSSKCSRQD